MASRLDLDLDLDLDVFIGPFDLLLTIVLREEISLLEVELGEIVARYVEKLEAAGELELEVATEFLVLIAALLELKSRLMLPGAEEDLDEMEPAQAVEELVARMLEYRRYRDAGRAMKDHFESQRGYLYRSAPLPPELRRVEVETASKVYEPDQLAAALGDLLEPPPRPDLSHLRATVSLRRRLSAVRSVLLKQPVFDFDDEFGKEDRMTQAVTIFALLDLYKKGEVAWEQSESCGPITVRRARPGQARLARTA
ncbi:MAG: segregation/condensation protein A [Solirubrobacterales bacterium]|nr:segregation/condensation protein A [Solirubrobacterales bacterium]